MKKKTELTVEDRAKLQELDFVFRNQGEDPSGQKVELQDILATSNAPMLLPKVMENIVKEAVEPLLVATSLLTPIQYQYGQRITFPAVGAMQAGDVAEGQEYPSVDLQRGGATVTAAVGKVGLSFGFTEEMLRYSQFGLMQLWLKSAGYAMARHKEVKLFNYIRNLGVPVFDNLNPTSSLFGVTTGRGLTGQPNGSLTMDNIFDGYGHILTQGFMPDTLLMNPLSWVMWVKDAALRSFVNQNGVGVYFASHTGNPAGRAPWGSPMGVSGGQTIVPGGAVNGQTASGLLSYPQTLNSAPVLPSYMNVPFRIIVSPFVPYDPVTKLTDIYMFDSRELGALLVDEEVTMDEWTDPRVDIKRVKLRERYAIAMFHEGQQAAVFKNVHVVPNEIVLPAMASIDVSGSALTAISPTASVL